MSKSICTTIRNQLDEMLLDEQHGLDIKRHLGECVECRDFRDKQTKLRQIVGSLGTVNAPPDFDFRLRSRLARDNSKESFWFLARRVAAVATAVVMIVGSAFLVRQLQNRDKVAKTVVEKKPSSEAGSPVTV